MRIFNNIQDFWNYAMYCPICEDFCRTISFNLYPDEIFKHDLSHSEIGNELIINFTFRNKVRDPNILYTHPIADGKLIINFITNEFNILPNETLRANIKKYLTLNEYYKMELFIQSVCKKCNSSVISTDDIELNLNSNKIKEIKIYSEEITLKIDSSEIYNIFQNYEEHKTVISILHTLDDDSLKRNSSFIHSLLDIDFSKIDKIYPRIKTILTFS